MVIRDHIKVEYCNNTYYKCINSSYWTVNCSNCRRYGSVSYQSSDDCCYFIPDLNIYLPYDWQLVFKVFGDKAVSKIAFINFDIYCPVCVKKYSW